MKSIVWLMFLGLVIYNGVDIYQTWLLVHMGFKELNPIVAPFMNTIGIVWGLVFYKGVILLGLAALLFWYMRGGEWVKI